MSLPFHLLKGFWLAGKLYGGGLQSKLLLPVDAHGNALFTWKTSVQYHVVVKADTIIEFYKILLKILKITLKQLLYFLIGRLPKERLLGP